MWQALHDPAANRRRRGRWTIGLVSVDHYENFPVASLLCPPSLRPAIAAIYWFARTADDIADEGDASPPQRLADLAAYGADLDALYDGRPVSSRWAEVFIALGEAVTRFGLPRHLLADLLSAFAQDVVQHHYADRAQLLDYCRRSANPVGRLLLHLYGIDTPIAQRRSDAICTALQLANFWQDLGIDLRRGRVYLPATDCARHGVTRDGLLAGRDSAPLRALVAEEVAWARALMEEGAPLVHGVPGRAGWELRLVVQGGLHILEKIARLDFNVIDRRPRLRAADTPRLVWRAMSMRRPSQRLAGKSA
jgi:squalene synthase HpnC